MSVWKPKNNLYLGKNGYGHKLTVRRISTKLTEAEHNAVVEDMSKIYPAVIRQLVALADKHNVVRDDMIKYFVAVFSAMVEICTFVNWEDNDGQNRTQGS